MDAALTSWERRLLLAVGLPLAVASVNFFGVILAMTDIAADLQVDFDQVRWLVAVFLLADVVLLALSGRAGDFMGRRRLMVMGALVFAAGAALSAVAPTYLVLLVTRTIEGAGAGLLFGSSLGVVADTFSTDRLGRAFGVWAFVGALGFGVAPLVCGLIVHHLGWRWLFAFNAVLAGVAAALLTRYLPADRRRGRVPFDPPGIVAGVLGLAALVVGLLQGPSWGWTSRTSLGMMALGVALLVVAVVFERSRDRPLWSPAVFTTPGFAPGTAVATVLYAVQDMSVLVAGVSLFLARDATAVEVGMLLLAYALVWPAVAPPSGRLADRIGTRAPILAGLSVALAGAVVLALAGTSIAVFLVGLAVLEFGMGTAMPPANAAAMAAVPAELRGEASGFNMTARMFGSVLGVAGGVSVFVTRHHGWLVDEITARGGDASGLRPATLGQSLPGEAGSVDLIALFGSPARLEAVTTEAVRAGVTATFVAAAVALAALLVAVTVATRPTST